MKGYSELKRLASLATPGRNFDRLPSAGGGLKYECTGDEGSLVLKVDHKNDEWGFVGDNGSADEEFFLACTPAAVLALIAEVELLESNNADMILRNKILRERPDLKPDRIACHSNVVSIQKELLNLKQENELLKKDAARYRWLRQYDFDIGSYHPEGDFSHESWFERFDDQSIDRMIAEEIAFEEEAIIEANNK